ncbi:GNAT family N-acetyltransferase [Breoghania sp.]|uniref:GNAT family N-acetyltransferase n=1 Tax=Breoghania sp. TaxID=2065378 RepID=UPI002634A4DC|nr:GNAT family N-acetyltransferase [Breoghania sp.]MDJ0932586.1 GNAT family N-acetyltransferase [Breoghania sp.]
MKIGAVTIRQARPEDAESLADIHGAAWRGAYRGVLSGVELERLLARCGVSWWHAVIRYKTRILVLEVCGTLAGYATFGHSRLKHLPFTGEIYELYLHPDYQGLGFGQRLFAAARSVLRECRVSPCAFSRTTKRPKASMKRWAAGFATRVSSASADQTFR